ncbi:MAG: DNA polymerase IV [Lachnospiraceae bacterium]|nr:DNA polymerase IV [Lachnospiraceae bacterium]
MAEKIIFHIDVNSAYLSWEAADRKVRYDSGDLSEYVDILTIPAIIGGNEELRHGIVLAKSPLAKSYGIQTGEAIMTARKKCPSIMVIPPNFKIYDEYSRRFIKLLEEYAPVVEQFSIDEAFCDMTGTEKLYGNPVKFAEKLKNMIYEQLGFTVNIGVSTNKLLAKMASDFKKPNLVHTLFPEEIPAKMWPLPVDDLFFVGHSSAVRLHSMGIHTIGELAKADKNLIVSHLKKHGETIWNYANGNDLDIVTDHKNAQNKGYGNSTTLPYDVTDRETAKQFILALCESVGARLRYDKVCISVISVQIVDNDFNNSSKQISLTSPTDITEKIYDHACTLFDKLWNGTPIRLLGVSTSKATTDATYQLDLFDNGETEKLKKLNAAIDSIRTKYGSDKVKRATLMDVNIKRK